MNASNAVNYDWHPWSVAYVRAIVIYQVHPANNAMHIVMDSLMTSIFLAREVFFFRKKYNNGMQIDC